MKTLLNKKISYCCAFLILASIYANAQSTKIAAMKSKKNIMLQMKQYHNLKRSPHSFGLKINPYWQDVNAPHVVSNGHVRLVQVPSPNAVWAQLDYDTAAYVANSFIRSADAGKTWRLDSVDAPDGYSLSGIAAVDANTCYAAMNDAFNYGGAMFKTTDGGDTWKQLQPGTLYSASSFPDIVYFFDAQHGVTVGDDDLIDISRLEIYITSDAGKTWQRVPDQNLPPTQGYAFSSNSNSYAVFQNRIWVTVGDTYSNSYIYRSDDFGKHWQQFPYTLATPIYGFAFSDKQNGLGLSFDFGDGSTHEVETHDGGKTWADKNFTGNPMGFFITSVPFTHDFVSTIPGGFTPISGSSYSDDFGATWKLIDTSSDFQPGALTFLNPFVGWCGRWDSPDPNGGMYKWKYQFSLDHNAISEEAQSLPGNIIADTKNATSLSVHPNPISSSTNISFTIPQSQKVSIQVYDGSGRLVKTISNAVMEAGTHQLTWDATGVAKGIYYLKFNAGSYLETKKLSVIK